MVVRCLGFRVSGTGIRVRGFGSGIPVSCWLFGLEVLGFGVLRFVVSRIGGSAAGFRVRGLRFRVSLLGFADRGFRFGFSASSFRVRGFAFRVSGFAVRVTIFGFRVLGL